MRLTGQDSRRGTFNQRHAALIDIETEEEYVPLRTSGVQSKPGARSTIRRFPKPPCWASSTDSAAIIPEALVLWEAQFGDFANGAQIIIDQFIAASEDKWNLLSGLVMLLPHGYEGQGPEHSSARIERFLQLAARDNMQICQPSTAAQYFHYAAAAGAARVAQAAGRVHAQRACCGIRRRLRRSRIWRAGDFQTVIPDSRRRIRRARAAVHRQNRPRARGGAQAATGESTGDRFRRAALSLPRSGACGGDGSPRKRARIRVGAGRAGQHGRARIRDSATRATGARTRGAVGEAFGEREPGDRFAQGARDGAEDAAGNGAWERKIAGVFNAESTGAKNLRVLVSFES